MSNLKILAQIDDDLFAELFETAQLALNDTPTA
jgi:hypothetical protein